MQYLQRLLSQVLQKLVAYFSQLRQIAIAASQAEWRSMTSGTIVSHCLFWLDCFWTKDCLAKRFTIIKLHTGFNWSSISAFEDLLRLFDTEK